MSQVLIRSHWAAIVLALEAGRGRGLDVVVLETRVIEPPAPVARPRIHRDPRAGRKPASLTPRAQRKGFRG